MNGYEVLQKGRIVLRQQQMHCRAVFTTANSTHLTVGGSKVTKIHNTMVLPAVRCLKAGVGNVDPGGPLSCRV